ncbi:flagellar filament capping protein FliD [Lysinibacillus endophyticus]|uniref:flagellar filament capping protein FliD n=1 Tax=Ureibacillus endophyticus TaxID=1978490 RepID=UPI003136B6D4
MSAMRIGGLASGMDIDSLVEKLMQAERAPLDKLEQKKQTYEWQRDAYRDVNTKLQTLDTYIADNLILKSITTKTATSSNSEYVTATATGSASGTLSIEGVSQLATAARSVGGQVNAVGSTTLKELFQNSGVPLPDSYNIAIRAIQKDGTLAEKPTNIAFTENTTISEFVSKINSSGAGVSAVFESGKLSITAMNTGDVKGKAEIVVDSGNSVFSAFKMADTTNLASGGANAIFQVNGIATERSTNTFTISGYSVTLKKTFNASNTIEEKLQAANTEVTNADADEELKLGKRKEAREAYFGSDAEPTITVTNDHNNAYTAAFGNTLSLSEQETYKKFSSSLFADFNPEEIANLTSYLTVDSSKNIDEIRKAIKDDINIIDSLEGKLLNLSKEQLETLDTLSVDQLNKFKDNASFEKFNNSAFFKGLTPDQITALANLTVDDTKTEAEIKAAIDSNPDLNLPKEALSKLTKDQLVQLGNMDNAQITDFQQKAIATELKSIYNSFDKNFFKDLTPTEINEIVSMDLSGENPLAGKSGSVVAKLEKLSTAQLNKLDSLKTNKLANLTTEEQLSNFKALATEDIERTNWQQAEVAYKAAETRLTEAIATQTKAQADYDALPKDVNGNVIDNSTPVDPVTMSSTTNVDEIITKIKEFVNTYNGLVKDLNNLTKESKYRDYQPLTAAQRKEMEESEIELWEKKAKSGLLRGDSIIQNGLSSMRSLIYESQPGVVNTKYNTLYSIGITSSKNYLEGGTLEIDEAKLRKALEEDPDAVATLFNNSKGKEKDTITIDGVSKEADTRGYLQKLRDSFDKIQVKIEERAGRSTMTENQFTLGKYLKDVNKRIDSWQEKLMDIESRYWRQFSAMESMINKANNQSAMLMGQFS